MQVSLHYLWKRLASQGVSVESLWKAIIDVVLRSLVCVEDLIPYQPNSFELFGYDILVDDKRQPWLLEVNASPSMARENSLDEKVRKSLPSAYRPLPIHLHGLLTLLFNDCTTYRSRRRLSVIPSSWCTRWPMIGMHSCPSSNAG